MKKFTIVLLSCTLGAISCKKEEETSLNSPAPVTFGTVEVTLLNDTVDFSATSNCFEWSIGMDFDSIHTDPYSPADYRIKSTDSSCVFTHKRELTFAAANNCRLLMSDNSAAGVKKYIQGQTIDYAGVNTSVASDPGPVSARILEEGVTSDFNLNETFYLGTAFLQNENHYNGWIKVKTLNNYYSCIIVSYGVCKTANTPVKAE